MATIDRQQQSLFLYDYYLSRALDEADKEVGPIKVSRARQIRERILGNSQAVAQQTWATMSDSILNDIEAEYPGFHFADRDDFKRTTAGEFAQMVRREGVLPVPMYASELRNIESIRKAGVNQLYIRQEDLENAVDGIRPTVQFTDIYNQNISSQLQTYNRPNNPDGLPWGPRDFVTLSDSTGLSRLSPYMTQKEFDNVAEWVNQIALDQNGQFNSSRIMSEQALERAAGVLQYLGENAIDYSIERDVNPGQIRARLTGTGITVRLMDEAGNERFVGTPRDNGTAIYYTTDRWTRNRTGNAVTALYENFSTEEAIDLIRFARGEQIMDKDRLDRNGRPVPVGTPSQINKMSMNGKQVTVNNSTYYLAGAPGSSGARSGGGNDFSAQIATMDNSGNHLFIHTNTSNHRRSTIYMTPETAEAKIRGQVDGARKYLREAMNMDAILEAYDNKQEFDNFSGDETIAKMQEDYVNFLNGSKPYLVKSYVDEDAYSEQRAELEAAGLPTLDDGLAYEYHEDTARRDVEAHFNDYLEAEVGTYEVTLKPYVTEDGQVDMRPARFNPVNVAKYSAGSEGFTRNRRELVQAMNELKMDAKELQGSEDDYPVNAIKDELIRFDKSTAKDMATLESPFMQQMHETVRESLRSNGVIPRSIQIDDNGIIFYQGAVPVGKAIKDPNKRGSAFRDIGGQIGQIFDPEANGSIETKFNGSKNGYIVPGYEATIAAQKEGESKSYIERTHLKGYESLMADSIRYQIRQNMANTDFSKLQATEQVFNPERFNVDNAVGKTTSLNSVYKRLYDERHDLDYVEKETAIGLDAGLLESRVETEKARVKYPNKYGDESGINADYQAKSGMTFSDPRNDNFMSIYELTGNENLTIMRTELSDGYFDPIFTSGGTNQGLTRYLVESARVAPDGTIIQGDKDDRTPLAKHDLMKHQEFNPFDRQQMTQSNMMTSNSVTEANVVMADANGLTFEDGVVVSKAFAERNKVYASNGEIRGLMVGDKLADLNGNKGVIPAVIDPDMSDEEAERQGILDTVKIFRNNPDLEIMVAKYSPVSRFNGGTARDMMEHERADFVDANGKVWEQSIGKIPMMITHMTVDEKTNVYDDAAMSEGRGRKASPQLAWALNAMDANGIMAEFYGNNNKAVYNYREYLNTLGYDMDETGTLRDHYEAHEGEERNIFNVPDVKTKVNANGVVLLQKEAMRTEFNNLLDEHGGFLAVPFELKFPDGRPMQKNEFGETLVPVLSSHLRNGMESRDGEVLTHDYSKAYQDVFDAVVEYKLAEGKLNGLIPRNGVDSDEKLKQDMESKPRVAQMAYDRLAKDIESRRIDGKHNYIRDGIMSNRLPHSATAVWSAMPNLELDQIAISPEIAENLDVTNDDYIMTWRDPVLADGGVRGLRVVVDERLTGCAINPIIAQSFEGDFDGDSVALVSVKSKEAKTELKTKLSQAANVLDKANFVEINGEKVHPLNFNFGLELKVYANQYPEFKETLDNFTLTANQFEKDYQNGEISKRDLLVANHQCVQAVSEVVKDAFSKSSGRPLSMKDMETHLQSVMDEVVLTGAKGSASKVKDYMKYLGVEADLSDDGKVSVNKVHEHSLATHVDHENTEYATGVKAFGTGVAGKFSQRGIAALRNVVPKEVLDLTHPVSQSVLQAKHDPVDARHKYELLMSTVRTAWRGKEVVLGHNPEGETVWQNGNQQSRLTADQWTDMMCEFYAEPNGLNIPVNRDQVKRIAEALTNDDGFVMDVETEGLRKLGAPMDRLSYDPGMATLKDLAKKGANIFEGKYTSQFAPRAIQQNMKAKEAGELLRPLVKQDVIVKDNKPLMERGTGQAEVTREEPAMSAIEQLNQLDAKNFESLSQGYVPDVEDHGQADDSYEPASFDESILDQAPSQPTISDAELQALMAAAANYENHESASAEMER